MWNDLELRMFSEKEKIRLPWWLFFSLVFVCNFEKGEMGRGSLCDSFVMDADGERFLLVSPPDYKMKTDFSIICSYKIGDKYRYVSVCVELLENLLFI